MGFQKGVTEELLKYINFELSGNDEEDDQLIKKAIFACYYCYYY